MWMLIEYIYNCSHNCLNAWELQRVLSVQVSDAQSINVQSSSINVQSSSVISLILQWTPFLQVFYIAQIPFVVTGVSSFLTR